MAVLEDDLGIAGREAVLVGNPPPQDEGVVVEPEVGGIEEEHFPNLQRLVGEPFGVEPDAVFLGGPSQDLAEVEQALSGREMVRPQDEFAFEILDFVEGKAVTVLARLQVGHAPRPPDGLALIVRRHVYLHSRFYELRLRQHPRFLTADRRATPPVPPRHAGPSSHYIPLFCSSHSRASSTPVCGCQPGAVCCCWRAMFW